MAADPIFVATPKNGTTQISTANTNRDGTGTLGTIYTAGSSGARIDSLIIQATVTTTAGMIRLYIADNAGSPVIRLLDEIPVTAVTPSGTVPAWQFVWRKFPIVLQASWTLRASTHNAETFNVIPVEAGDF